MERQTLDREDGTGDVTRRAHDFVAKRLPEVEQLVAETAAEHGYGDAAGPRACAAPSPAVAAARGPRRARAHGRFVQIIGATSVAAPVGIVEVLA